MATVITKTCDITGKRETAENPVKAYQVRIETWADDPLHEPTEIFKATLELRPDGFERLLAFVRRGTTPSKRKSAGAVESAGTSTKGNDDGT